MSQAARAVARDIEKQSAALAGGAANTLALKAAAAGLSEQFKPAIESLKRVEAASAAAKGEAVALFGQSEAAATAYYSKLDALTAKAAAEISQVRAAQRQFDAEIRGRSEGGVSDADKKLLAASKTASEQRIQQLQREFNEQAAVIKQDAQAAAVAEAAAAKQVAAARRVIDQQNGLNAGYREQLRLLRELRDAGQLTPQQFRAAGAQLVTQQPVLQANRESQALASRILAETQGVTKFQQSLKGVADQSRLTKYEMLTLNYTISDVVASIASGINPMTILLQQGGQVRDVFGGIGPAFSKIASLFTVTRVAIGGMVAAVGALTVAMFKGSEQSRQFADAIDLSGNFAGKTEGSFNALTQSVAQSTSATVATVREFGQALLSTGEIGPRVFDSATRAAVAYGAASGKTAKEVAASFAEMARDPAKFAAETNRQLNFVSAAQLQLIRSLQDSGRAFDAQGVIIDALNARFPNVTKNLGTLERAWQSVGKFASDAWQSMLGIGRAETAEERIASLAARLRALSAKEAPENTGAAAQVRRGSASAETQATRVELRARQQAQGSAQAAAEGAAELARLNKEAADAGPFIQGMLARANTTSALKRELEAANLAFAKQDALAAKDPTFKVTSVADRTAIFKNIIESNTRKGPKEKIDREPEQVRREQLAADLKALQDAFQNERDTIAFHNREVAALYQAGTVSLKTFNESRVREIEDGTKREVDVLLKEIARLKKELENPLVQKNDSERVKIQGQIAEATEKTTKVVVSGARAARLANLEAGQSYKQLGDQVASYRANLLQLQGDEVGAARIRTDQAIKAAQELARRTQDAPNAADRITPAQLAAEVEALRNGERLLAVQIESRRVNELLGISEDRIALLREKGSIGELDALALQGQARQKVVAALEAQLAAMQKVYDESTTKNPQLLLDIERARLEIDKLTASLDPLKEKFDNLLKGAGEGFFETLLGGKGLRAALQSFTSTVTAELNRITAKELSRQVFGEGGILGGAGGFLAGAFGGKGGGEAAAQTAATAAITAAQASSAAAIATANATAEAATATAIVTAITASTTAIVSAIGASATLSGAGGFLNGAGGLELLGSLGFARGGVFGAQRFASGGIFNSPTLFQFADGGAVNRLGVMGEAGPEAVMPLRRGPDGKLGVAASGGRDGGTRVINYKPTFVIPPGPVTNRTLEQVEAAAFRGMQKAASRGTAGVRV